MRETMSFIFGSIYLLVAAFLSLLCSIVGNLYNFDLYLLILFATLCVMTAGLAASVIRQLVYNLSLSSSLANALNAIIMIADEAGVVSDTFLQKMLMN
jgi:hypothetical protein